jgi:hypothetical protein
VWEGILRALTKNPAENVTLNPEVLTVVALAAAGVAVIAFVLSLRNVRRVTRLKRAMRLVSSASGATAGTDADVAADVVKTVERLDRETGELYDVLRRAVTRVGLVRFDAFEDMGGHLSFCAALLDIDGNGVVLTAINGRTETRTYAKPVTGGASKYHLSEEESEAIRRAVSGVRE